MNGTEFSLRNGVVRGYYIEYRDNKVAMAHLHYISSSFLLENIIMIIDCHTVIL